MYGKDGWQGEYNMNIKQEISKIAKALTANSASSQYREKQQSIQYLLTHIEKALAKHANEQKNEPEHYGYVGDLGFVQSQLKEILETLAVRK